MHKINVRPEKLYIITKCMKKAGIKNETVSIQRCIIHGEKENDTSGKFG